VNLIDEYHNQCRLGDITEDQAQLTVMRQLQALYEQLASEAGRGITSWLRAPKTPQGLYVWGGVGAGKTFMMDCFYHALPFGRKMRMHFHPFMRHVHEQLKYYQGKKNPLELVARDIAKKARVLCFDEFVVSDIADAIILARLLDALFKQGVCLVATSNVKPDDLYKNGLQRHSFLPAIALLKKYTQEVHIQTAVDYRLRYLKDAGVFYCPDDENAKQRMEKTFSVLSHEDNEINTNSITVCERAIRVVKEVENVVWFDFDVICKPPRSQHDYLELVTRYHTIFISHIPQIKAEQHDRITLFIRLIDVLYDAKIKLVFSAAVPIAQIYPEGRFEFEFGRTQSRLLEMQSESYLRG
jgi:cell division protein ZapE